MSAAMLGSGVAAAAVLAASPSPSPSPDQSQADRSADNQSDDGGIHGGAISRFHRASGCNLLDVSTLPGSWTHGDHVSAVEALGNPSLVPIAAHSDCGKPMVAVGHRHGPPDFVLHKIKAGHGGASRETPGS